MRKQKSTSPIVEKCIAKNANKILICSAAHLSS